MPSPVFHVDIWCSNRARLLEYSMLPIPAMVALSRCREVYDVFGGSVDDRPT